MVSHIVLGNPLPKNLKDKIIRRLYGVESHDVFRTAYKLNSARRIRGVLPKHGFEICRLELVEDIHMFSPVVFEMSVRLYKLQRMKMFHWLRNCIICWAKRV